MNTGEGLLAELIRAVKEMRRLQRAWFGGDKSAVTGSAARKAERRVDHLLRKVRHARQQELFQ